MKRTIVSLATVLVVIGLLYFSKPSDNTIRWAVKDTASEDSVFVKQLYYTLLQEGESFDEMYDNGISIEDKVLYKKVTFTVADCTQVIGSAYLWTFYRKPWKNDYLKNTPSGNLVAQSWADQLAGMREAAKKYKEKKK